MLGYVKDDVDKMISGLCGITTTKTNVENINKVIDFLEGLIQEGHI